MIGQLGLRVNLIAYPVVSVKKVTYLFFSESAQCTLLCPRTSSKPFVYLAKKSQNQGTDQVRHPAPCCCPNDDLFHVYGESLIINASMRIRWDPGSKISMLAFNGVIRSQAFSLPSPSLDH